VTADLRAEIEAWAAPQWRTVPEGLSPLDGVVGAYIQGRNDSIDQIRALLAAHPVQDEPSAKVAPSYSKTGSSVTTVERLDLLPVGSVWRTARGLLGETTRTVRGQPHVRIDGVEHLTLTIGGADLPVTVLYRPEVTP